jgi:hypothetical protein
MEAVSSVVQNESEQELQFPNLFIVLMHPGQAELLQADEDLIEGFKQSLNKAAHEIGLDIPAPLALWFESDPGLAQGEVKVLARNSQEDISQTNDVLVSFSEISDRIPEGSFLIVNGIHIFPLEQAVVNIGRRPDNHLIVDDPRVSRLHAQLRLIRGRYIIFDLDSTGGTWVNGQRVRQQILISGDVISLSGVPVIFGQDSRALSETQEYIPNIKQG